MNKPYVFAYWWQAFSACRELDAPLRVYVVEPDADGQHAGTVFPSGCFRLAPLLIGSG